MKNKSIIRIIPKTINASTNNSDGENGFSS